MRRIHKDQTSQEHYTGLGHRFRPGVPQKIGVAGKKRMVSQENSI